MLERASLDQARERIESELGPVDILINGAGGNHPKGTTSMEFLTEEVLRQVDADAVTFRIAPHKDVDGLHPVNAGRLLLGEPGHRACTPLGIMKILERHEIPLKSANAVVIGRSAIVGKPISLLLQQAHATVTMCHSRTRDLLVNTLNAYEARLGA